MNITKVSVDSGVEISNDSDGSNTAMQNDNDLSSSTLPIPYEHLVKMFRHGIMPVTRITQKNYPTYKGYSKASCTIEEIDQPASSLSKDVIDTSHANTEMCSEEIRKAIMSGSIIRMPSKLPVARRRYASLTLKERCDIISSLHLTRARRKALRSRSTVTDAAAIHASYELRMFTATSLNNVEAVERLLAIGVSPNCTDNQGRTPLHLAAANAYKNVVNSLLKHGGDAKASDHSGTSVLQAAINSGDETTIAIVNAAVNRPINPRISAGIIPRFPNGDANGFEPEVDDTTNNICWMNNTRRFDQQVEALSNVCSRLSFSNGTDELQRSA